MQTHLGPVPPPADDKQWEIVGAAARRHGLEPHALTHADGPPRLEVELLSTRVRNYGDASGKRLLTRAALIRAATVRERSPLDTEVYLRNGVLSHDGEVSDRCLTP
jgi:hypothetical protein